MRFISLGVVAALVASVAAAPVLRSPIIAVSLRARAGILLILTFNQPRDTDVDESQGVSEYYVRLKRDTDVDESQGVSEYYVGLKRDTDVDESQGVSEYYVGLKKKDTDVDESQGVSEYYVGL